MMTLGALTIAAPAVLLGLLALPVLWWLLRVSPPAPRRQWLPSLRLLLGLDHSEQTPKQMPLWLLLLRLALAAIVLILLSGPTWNAQNYGKRSGPLVLVVDNGWASAPGWDVRKQTLASLTAEAVRMKRPIVIVPTAWERPLTFSLLPPNDGQKAAQRLAPQSFPPDRRAVIERLPDLGALLDAEETMKRESEIIWLTDGFDYGNAARFAETLSAIAPLTVLTEAPSRLALSLAIPQIGEDGSFNVPVQRAYGAANHGRGGKVALYDGDGRVLGTAPFAFATEEIRTLAQFDLPADLRNRATRIALTEGRSAAGIVLLDSRWRRRPVGLISGSGQEERPLVSDMFYLRRALEPYAEVLEGSIANLIKSGLSVLVLSDVGQLVGEDVARVGEWVDQGGVLIRFAGPRLAQNSDDLIPVPLRRGGRALGGTLSWETPQKLGAFDENGPFASLPLSEEVVIFRQVLAEPNPDLASKTWARLSDGTPLVTATRRGNGWLILVHVTANQDWSTLPLSGLYVEMLRRMIDLSAGIADDSSDAVFSGPLAPFRVMNGFGELVPPSAQVQPLTSAGFEASPDARHPPGLYGREGNERAYNLASTRLAVRAAPREYPNTLVGGYIKDEATDLRPWLAGLALLLILADFIVTLNITGHLTRLAQQIGRGAAPLILIALMGTGIMAPRDAHAFTPLQATQETHLAYVMTGDAASDTLARQGLEALTRVLISRTAFEPGPPIGVNPDTDDLVFFPLIYWRVTPNQRPLSPQALSRIDQYMKNGGTIIFDTADSADPDLGGAGQTISAGGVLRAILGTLDIPPLQPVPEGHVLRRAFYLLDDFPGRYAGSTLWVEARNPEDETETPSQHDGVSPIVIGGNDWAAAWAKDASGQPLVATTPGGERQREMAYRFGVNLVLYTLSGNYKADQVHVKELLERIGQ